jgi:hypothetical protein
MGADYLHTPAQWDKMVAIVRAAGVAGFDTEYFGNDPSKESGVGKSIVHVWSIAVRTGRMGVRGFGLCRGWCLPAAALLHPPVKELLEDAAIRKEIHNQPVDNHAVLSHGITLKGGRNTLDYIKWKIPGLINTPGRFKLKTLMNSLLGRNPVCTFKELVTDTRTIQVPYVVKRVLKGCSCGVEKCRARKTQLVRIKGVLKHVEHVKTKERVLVTKYREKQEEFTIPLQDIVPGHYRWDLLVKYSIEDSVAALQIAEVADDTPDPAPYPYDTDIATARVSTPGKRLRGERPKYSQAVIEAIIKMEQAGFRRDKEYCAKQLIVANEDEQTCLNWLYRWYVVNSGEMGPHGRNLKSKVNKAGKVTISSGTDGIWGSGAKKLRLFDSLGFPRSPVWAKGKVKEGKAKLDWKAMEWIAKHHPPAKQIVEKLLHLGRIRSGKKYLQKLHDADEIVHPICGPAGDEDERSGAVTGRLGIKGTLEAQQLPKKGKKDLYGVRRAIIA